MLAKLQGGKTYYSIVRPNWGTGGFAPTPIRHASADEPTLDGKEFKEWNAGTKRLEPNEDAPACSRTTRSACSRSTPNTGAGSRPRPIRKRQRTLLPEDGR